MFTFCSMTKIVVPCSLMARMMSKTCSTSFGARPIDGSSMQSSVGCVMSARPMASICCSPPDSVPASWERRSLSRGKRPKTRSSSSAQPGSARRV